MKDFILTSAAPTDGANRTQPQPQHIVFCLTLLFLTVFYPRITLRFKPCWPNFIKSLTVIPIQTWIRIPSCNYPSLFPVFMIIKDHELYVPRIHQFSPETINQENRKNQENNCQTYSCYFLFLGMIVTNPFWPIDNMSMDGMPKPFLEPRIPEHFAAFTHVHVSLQVTAVRSVKLTSKIWGHIEAGIEPYVEIQQEWRRRECFNCHGI